MSKPGVVVCPTSLPALPAVLVRLVVFALLATLLSCKPLPCLRAHVLIRSQEDLDRLQEITCITGTLDIAADSVLPAVELASIEEISDGFGVVGTSSVRGIRMPNLRRLPGGGLSITNNSALLSFEASQLSIVGGTIVISRNTVLEGLVLPRIEKIGLGGLQILRNPRIRNVDLPTLTELEGGGMLGGVLSGGGFLVDGCERLERIDASRLASVTGHVAIDSNSELRGISLPALQLVKGNLAIRNNPSLPSCSVQNLIDRLQSGHGVGGQVLNLGNLDPSVCP
ncbi:MAG: hypothetical protein HY903_06995 [Deltaproteobacteria bacterium]|nr:hypothetical protein [Deltaproteobacteria bacterium]